MYFLHNIIKIYIDIFKNISLTKNKKSFIRDQREIKLFYVYYCNVFFRIFLSTFKQSPTLSYYFTPSFSINYNLFLNY
jgi:hypothetical protein